MPTNDLQSRIDAFLHGSPHAVFGASTNRSKFGNKVLRAYMRAGREVIPINPHEAFVEGLRAYKTVADLPGAVHGVSIVTPPAITEQGVREMIAAGIKHLWMQPGAVSDEAVALARADGLNVIAGDACILVVLGGPGE